MEPATDYGLAFDAFMTPYLSALKHKVRQRWAPIYVRGVLARLERKAVKVIATCVAPEDYDQLHHFVSTSNWAVEPIETILARDAQRLVGGKNAVLIIDDTSLLKQGQHSVGVAHQYSGEKGGTANCQALVTLTLAKREVPVPLALRLFLPKAWTADSKRCSAACVPAAQRDFHSKGGIALAELDRVQQEGVTFDAVVADAGYGASASFRQELSKRDLRWAVGIHSTQKVYTADVAVMPPRKPDTGRPAQHPHIADKRFPVQHLLASLPRHAWQKLSWRRGTKGRLKAHFVGLRVRAADNFRGSYGEHTPSAEVWLIGERRASGEIRYYLTNHPAVTPLLKVVAVLKARWACEQVHQQLKTNSV